MQKHLMALQAAIATWQPSIANQIWEEALAERIASRIEGLPLEQSRATINSLSQRMHQVTQISFHLGACRVKVEASILSPSVLPQASRGNLPLHRDSPIQIIERCFNLIFMGLVANKSRAHSMTKDRLHNHYPPPNTRLNTRNHLRLPIPQRQSNLSNTLRLKISANLTLVSIRKKYQIYQFGQRQN